MKKLTREDYESRILRVQIHIQNHLNDQLTLDALSKVACFSSYHFHRIFKAMVGESVKEHIRRLRLENSALSLMYSTKSVTEIAFEAGYDTHESFTRAFRKMFDMPPKAYRDNPPNGTVNNSIHGQKLVATLLKPKGDNMQVEIKYFEAMTVAAVRHVGPYFECAKAWHTICSDPSVMAQFKNNPLFIGICYDDPDVTDEGKIRFDACITVDDTFEANQTINKQTIEGGDYAVFLHKGSYSGLHDTYRSFFRNWLPDSGREVKSFPSLEIYLNSPENTREEDLLTEIRVPLL